SGYKMASLIPWNQIRMNTVNFFQRRTQGELWKTLTSVSKSGMKKGRKNTRQPIRNLNRFYRIGASPMKVQFPGLNAPLALEERDASSAMNIVEQTEEEMKGTQMAMRTELEQKKTKKRANREKLHPLERGFSGTQIVGQKLGPPPPNDSATFDDFETYCLEVKRTSNMTRVFGRVHTMSTLVFTGNGKGLAGYAVGKAPLHRTSTAIVNAMKTASRKLFYVQLHEDRTIYQDFYAECRNTRVFAQRRPAGFGLTCHPRLQKICEAIGIKDIYVKVEGSTKNYLALTHAFITGLLNQETFQQIAERKGLHVVEMSPSRHFLPEKIASPIVTGLKTEDELLPIDRLNLDDFYGEGRYPLRKPKPAPFYANLPSHLEAEWRKQPFRNHEKVMHRLLADGVVPRWTRDARREWGARKSELALAGVEPLSTGIGLSHVVPKKE
ncbi:hypothetical protein PFISCL1PPCAC_817, partial [Pristionchus fissidentatus]